MSVGSPARHSDLPRTLGGILLAAASALLVTLAFPPVSWCGLVWIGFVPMLISQYRVMPPHLSSLAPAIAIGGWLGGYLIPIFGGTGSYMAWLPVIIGVVTLFMDRGNRAFHERTGYRWFVLRGSLTWIGIEMIRSLAPIMGTWAFLANTLYARTWLIQPVSIFGVFGLGLLIMIVNHALAQAAFVVIDRRTQPFTGFLKMDRQLAGRWLIAAFVLVAAWSSLSLAIYSAADGAGPSIKVAALHIAGRVPDGMGYEKDPARRAELFARLLGGTREAAAAGAQLVVWPEGALDYDPQVQEPGVLRELAVETGAYIAFGYMVTAADGTWRNEATVVSPAGQFLGIFGKDHPVVFGGERNTSLGIYPVYETSIGRLATIICYDLDFTDTTRKMARNGAQVIAVPSLDWPAIATKHYTHVVFRAIENRVAMVKSDGGYDSAIIDPWGRVVAKIITPDPTHAILVAEVPLGTGATVAARLGDWVGWISLLGLVSFAVLDIRTRKRSP